MYMLYLKEGATILHVPSIMPHFIQIYDTDGTERSILHEVSSPVLWKKRGICVS